MHLVRHNSVIIPIPGTRRVERLDENLAAGSIELTPQDVREIDAAPEKFDVHGARGTGHEQYG